MNLDALLGVREGDSPSGENLEYDSDFIQMDIAATPGQERQKGDKILPAEEPDFADVEAKAQAIMERSHDLRAGAVYAGAALNTKGLPGLADAVAYIVGCLDQYWETCHPQLDAEDDNDPTSRINAVAGLASAGTILRWLRKTPLTRSRTFGKISLRDIQVATGEFQPAEGETNPDRAIVRAAFEDTDADFLTTQLDAAKTAIAGLKAIDAKFRTQTPGFGPGLDELTKMLQQVVRHMSEYVAAPAGAEAESDANEPESDTAAPVATSPARRAGGGGAPGAIETQRDVTVALDAIISYYRRAEPSSPIPIVLERAKRMVGADFMSIVKDMAPKGLENVLLIGGIED